MTQITRSAIVCYSASEMYKLVADIESYPEFLPWCGAAEVLSDQDNVVRASVGIAYKGISKSFTTENRHTVNEIIDMSLIEGPFKKLNGVWEFTALDEEASKVSLKLDFEFSNALVGMTLGKVFTSIADTLVDSFCKRAESVYKK